MTTAIIIPALLFWTGLTAVLFYRLGFGEGESNGMFLMMQEQKEYDEHFNDFEEE